jgi:hypothetical protein
MMAGLESESSIDLGFAGESARATQAHWWKRSNT